MNVRLYILQRTTAVIMAPLVLGHLIVIFYATRRTRGSIGWGLFYGLFVLAVSVHGAIGVRAIVSEWTPLKDKRALDVVMWGFGLVLAALGLRAVVAVVL
jgi:fumarate reductase subunit C